MMEMCLGVDILEQRDHIPADQPALTRIQAGVGHLLKVDPQPDHQQRAGPSGILLSVRLRNDVAVKEHPQLFGLGLLAAHLCVLTVFEQVLADLLQQSCLHFVHI